MNRFEPIKIQLQHFVQRASKLDANNEQHNHKYRYHRLFDEHLFKCQSHLLVPYIHEATQTLDTLICTASTDKSSGNTNWLQQTEFLTEKLVNQINAISRQLALESTLVVNHGHVNTQNNRPEIKQTHIEIQHQLETLYSTLAQHKQWEQRLSNLVSEKKQILQKQKQLDPEKNAARETSAVIEAQKRLARCQQATEEIQQQLMSIEKTI